MIEDNGENTRRYEHDLSNVDKLREDKINDWGEGREKKMIEMIEYDK